MHTRAKSVVVNWGNNEYEYYIGFRGRRQPLLIALVTDREQRYGSSPSQTGCYGATGSRAIAYDRRHYATRISRRSISKDKIVITPDSTLTTPAR